MQRLLVLLAACAAAVLAGAASPAGATPSQDATCVVPAQRPLWLDFGTPDVEAVLARPGLVVSGSTGAFPARLRSKGVRTVYWDMYLSRRVGTPMAPFAPETVLERANRLYDFAVTQMGCRDPIIALNELHGASLETPWSERHAQYRENVMILIRALAARGARPHLLVSSDAYTGTEEAAEWWRTAARHATLVREVYFSYRPLHKLGPTLANRRIRVAMRRAITRLTEIGIAPARLGLMLGFHPIGTGALNQTDSFELVKWQALAAAQVARELTVPYVWSWGWGTYRAGIDRSLKPKAACVYLWSRNPSFCDGPATAGPGFDTSRTEGQLILPRGAQCTVGKRTITAAQVAALTRVTGDRDVALSVLLARLAESPYASVRGARVVAAERAVLAAQFRGSGAAYRAALARAGASVSIARGGLADEVRRLTIESRLRVGRPSARAVVAFYTSYPDILARRVEAKPRPWWLGRRLRGVAIAPLAPRSVFTLPGTRRSRVLDVDATYSVRPLGDVQPLGSLPFAEVRPAIEAALAAFDRRAAFERWSVGRQVSVLRSAVCRRDQLPDPGTVRLSGYLPFLTTSG